MSNDKKEELNESQESEQQPLMIDEASQDDDFAEAVRRKNMVVDEEDETWTNQPSVLDDDSLEADLEDREDEDAEHVRVPKKLIQSGRDVVCEELPERAQRATMRLKPFLTGMIVFELVNSGERFVLDWREESPKVSPIAREAVVTCDEGAAALLSDVKLNVDTVISISENHLMAIRSGNLNPQLGMLTDKIRVKGKVAPAVYIFNLIAPRARS